MLELEGMMRVSVRDVMGQAILDYAHTRRPRWMQKWPGAWFMFMYRTVLYCTVQYSTEQYSVVKYSIVLHCAVQHFLPLYLSFILTLSSILSLSLSLSLTPRYVCSQRISNALDKRNGRIFSSSRKWRPSTNVRSTD